MDAPGYADGVAQIEGTRYSPTKWVVRFTCTRQWAREHGGRVGAVIVGRGASIEAAMDDATQKFWFASGYKQEPPLPD